MATTKLESVRLTLEWPLLRVDAGTLAAHFQDEEQGRYMIHVPYPYSIEDAYEFLDYLKYIENDPEMLELGIFSKENGQLIGMISLVDIDWQVCKAELGYWIAKECWGQGYAKEAAQAILTYGFQELGLQRIEAETVEDNAASRGLLETLGFRLEGVLRRSAINKGEIVNRCIYSLLVEEFCRK